MLELPCGQCIGCRLAKAKAWAVRLVHEAQMHEKNSFITLTYDEEHLPKDRSLNVKHWQDFAKRLRHEIGPFRFYHCGEYGDQTWRPHYHAILFGLDFREDRKLYKAGKGYRLYTSAVLEKKWGAGFCTVADFSIETAAYVARYTVKKITGEDAEEWYMRVSPEGECWQVKPEYATMSRRPGIGSAWLEKFESDVYPGDTVIHNGKRFRPPRFYDERIDSHLLEFLKRKRRKAASGRQADLEYERLRVREDIALRQHRRISR